jgi:hypothetical protein
MYIFIIKLNNMNKEQILGVFRHILTFVGGTLITKGIFDPELANEIVGTVVTVIGTVWSVIAKKRV